MSVYQADICQCPSHLSKGASYCVVIEGATITSFLISCIKRLWDVVGHFLGLMIGLEKFMKINCIGGDGRCFLAAIPHIC